MMLQKNSLFFFFGIAIALLLVGAGCSNTAPQQVTQQPTDTEQVIVRKPEGAGTIDFAITACENYGYSAVLRYNETTKETSTYCEFGNGYACEAIGFITGNCTTTSTNRIYLPATDGVPNNIRTCTTEETPVCSADGITYVNSCIASLQYAEIRHDGVCTDEEIESAVASGSSSSSGSSSQSGSRGSGSSSTGSGSAGSGSSANTSWLSYLSAIAAGPNTGSGAPTKEICTYGSTTVYYMVEKCPNCFSTLYNTAGSVICHPHNDIANECPSYFNKDHRGGNCRPI